MHAARLAEKLGLEKVVIPAGRRGRLGDWIPLAPASYEIVRSLPMRLDEFNGAKVEALLAALREEAQSVVRAAAGDADIYESRHAYMRYLGQGYEIAVHVTDAMNADKLKTAFEGAYSKLYGRTIPGMGIEILSWSLRVSAAAPARVKTAMELKRRKIAAGATRSVFDAGSEKRIPFGVFDREALKPGDEVEGPALIIETQTTTVVSSSFSAHIEGSGAIILERRRIE
ncbi:MAG: hypothetical protein R3C60_07990 [Parvularculaceae bacterium]